MGESLYAWLAFLFHTIIFINIHTYCRGRIIWLAFVSWLIVEKVWVRVSNYVIRSMSLHFFQFYGSFAPCVGCCNQSVLPKFLLLTTMNIYTLTTTTIWSFTTETHLPHHPFVAYQTPEHNKIFVQLRDGNKTIRVPRESNN